MSTNQELQALADKIKALTTERKLSAGIEMLVRGRADLAEVFVQAALEELQLARLRPKARDR